MLCSLVLQDVFSPTSMAESDSDDDMPLVARMVKK